MYLKVLANRNLVSVLFLRMKCTNKSQTFCEGVLKFVNVYIRNIKFRVFRTEFNTHFTTVPKCKKKVRPALEYKSKFVCIYFITFYICVCVCVFTYWILHIRILFLQFWWIIIEESIDLSKGYSSCRRTEVK